MLRVRKEFVWGSLSLWWKNIIIGDQYICILYHQHTHFHHISILLQISSKYHHILTINIVVSNFAFTYTGCYKSLRPFFQLYTNSSIILWQIENSIFNNWPIASKSDDNFIRVGDFCNTLCRIAYIIEFCNSIITIGSIWLWNLYGNAYCN